MAVEGPDVERGAEGFAGMIGCFYRARWVSAACEISLRQPVDRLRSTITSAPSVRSILLAVLSDLMITLLHRRSSIKLDPLEQVGGAQNV